MELYRLGTRQHLLYAWQPVCKWVKTVQKTVPLWYLSGNNQCPDFKKRYPLTAPHSGSKRNIFLRTALNARKRLFEVLIPLSLTQKSN